MAKKPSADDLRKLKDKAAEAAGKGRFERAAELYREAADGDPRDIGTRQKLADTLRRAGRTADAIAAYREVADRFGKDGLLIKAIAIAKIILELDPEHSETQAALADLYAKKARAEGARAPARTMVVQAMKAAAAAPQPPRPVPPRPADDSVVAIALGPPPSPPTLGRDPFAPPPTAGSARRPPPPAPPAAPPEAIEINVEPELPEIEVPLEPGPLPADLVLGAAPAPGPEPTLDAEPLPELVAEPAVPSPSAAPAARPITAFAHIVLAAEAAVESGIEEDLLVRADPVDAEVLDDEPLSLEPASAGRDGVEPAAALEPDEALELVVEPEPPAQEQPLLVREPEPIPEPPRATPPPAARPAPPSAAPAAPLRPGPARQPTAPRLPRIPIFSDVGRDAFVELTRGMVLHHVSRGEAVLREGEEGTSFYVVAGGKLSVSKRDDASGRIVLAHLGDGDFFGEMALLSGAPRSATVTAEEECEILEFRADVLLDIAGHHPHVAQSLRKFYRQRLLANALAASPIFRPFQRSDRKLIMERFRAREVTEGEVVIREGTPSDGLYVVLEGAVDVLKQKEGQSVVVGQLREGDLFGEMSCLRKAPASATIVVRRPGTLLRLPRQEFDDLVVTYPQILELVSTLSEERAENLDAILSGHAEWTDEGLVLT